MINNNNTISTSISKRGDYVVRMPNVLHSKNCRFLFIWFPKCACSTVRQFFLEWHKTYNPQFDQSHVEVTYHNLHTRLAYREDVEKVTSVELAFLFFRHPVCRFLSNFFNKHVLQKDFNYLSHTNFRQFVLWLDIYEKPYTMKSYLEYLQQIGFMDIHDLPMMEMIPSWWTSIPQKKRIVIDIDTQPLTKMLRTHLMTLSMFQGARQRHTFSKYFPLFQKFPTLNCTKKEVIPSTTDFVNMWTWSLEEWRRYYQTHDSFPSYHALWIKWIEHQSLFQDVYGKDLQFYYQKGI